MKGEIVELEVSIIKTPNINAIIKKGINNIFFLKIKYLNISIIVFIFNIDYQN